MSNRVINTYTTGARAGLRWLQATLGGLAVLSAVAAADPTQAQEIELSFYTGVQSAPHSTVDFTDALGASTRFTAGWEGLSAEMPPYYGLRATRWSDSGFGWGLEFTHAKVYADATTLATNGFSVLEMTDGINILTVNAQRRWQNDSRWTPYVGAGLGIAIPHVEVTTPLGNCTFEYQFTGPALRLIAGVSYEINDRWSVFGEYNGTYSMHDVSLTGGGTMQTNIVTNALNVGVSIRF